MLSPKRTKFRKAFKGRIHGLAKGGTTLNFGAYGLKAVEPGRVTARQIEAARRAITRHIKRVGRVWIRIFPDVPVTTKPAEVRMGSGKGSVEFWVCRVKPGRVMFELDGVTAALAKEAFDLGAAKLPISTRFIQRLGEEGVQP
jgi:large subunit ribosomal protein L16